MVQQNLISHVPLRCMLGHMCRVTRFVQLSAFLSMNLSATAAVPQPVPAPGARRGRTGQRDPPVLRRIPGGERSAGGVLPGDGGKVFQTYDLARGELMVRGRVNCTIRRTALFTVEGERDDICSVGQTVAAQDLCPNVRSVIPQNPPCPGGWHHLRRGRPKWNHSTNLARACGDSAPAWVNLLFPMAKAWRPGCNASARSPAAEVQGRQRSIFMLPKLFGGVSAGTAVLRRTTRIQSGTAAELAHQAPTATVRAPPGHRLPRSSARKKTQPFGAPGSSAGQSRCSPSIWFSKFWLSTTALATS